MNNIQEQYIFHLTFRFMTIIDILYFARSSKKCYNYVENYLKTNSRRFKNIIDIPKDIKEYNSIIHYLCEEFVSIKCHKCGMMESFYYKNNWDLRICRNCLKPSIHIINRCSIGRKRIKESDIKGFTKYELRKILIYSYDISSGFRGERIYYDDDVKAITKNRYSFENYKKYLQFIRTRKYERDKKTVDSISKKIGIRHNLIFCNPECNKSKSGFLQDINTSEIKECKKDVKKAIVRYNMCRKYVANNKYIYNSILIRTNDDNWANIMTILRVKI